jgi:type VI protein secretion system component Hcp
MIRQSFDAEGFWKVIVYYNVDYNFFDSIKWELMVADISKEGIEEVWDIMSTGEAKAVTCSNVNKHISVVLFNSHTSAADYINSLVHEAEHVKQAMLQAYRVEDEGEPSAYTVGYIVMRMYEVFKKLV